MGTVVDVLGRIVIENQKNALVTLITEGIARYSFKKKISITQEILHIKINMLHVNTEHQ